MDPQNAIDLCRDAVRTCLMVGGPILLLSLLIGLLISVFQATTQLHDQTISFVPKILLLLVAIACCLPWLTDRMTEFARDSFSRPRMATGQSFAAPTPVTSPDSWLTPSRIAALPDVFSTPSFRRSQESQLDNSASSPNSPDTPAPDNDTSMPAKSRSPSPFQLPQFKIKRTPTVDLEG